MKSLRAEVAFLLRSRNTLGYPPWAAHDMEVWHQVWVELGYNTVTACRRRARD